MKKHKHRWEFKNTNYEFPVGIYGTASAKEYAYLFCQCTEVRKVEIKLIQPDTGGENGST